jgi:hypothetical protein
MTDRPMPSVGFGTKRYPVEADPEGPEHQPLWVELEVCYMCGAVVHDTNEHMSWHVWLNEKLGQRPSTAPSLAASPASDSTTPPHTFGETATSDAVVYKIDFTNVGKIYIGSDLYNRPHYMGSMSPETRKRLEADHERVNKPIESTKTILWRGSADERLRVEMAMPTQHRSNRRAVGYNLFPRLIGENMVIDLRWNPLGNRNPITDMDEAHTSWGTYAKRKHRPGRRPIPSHTWGG